MESQVIGPIHIITDDLALSGALESLFQSVNVKSTTYNGSIQGVSAFKTAVKSDNAPQFVLIDASLKGDRDGFQVSEEITACDFHDDSIRVILTDRQIPFTKLLTATSGASAVLAKAQNTGLGILEELDHLARRKSERQAERTRVTRAARSGDDYLKAIVIFVLAGLALWSISNRISDARWQGEMQGQLKADQQHTERLLKIMKDDVDMSWAYVFLLRDQMRESGLKPPSIPKRPNYSDELEK
jgi:DNA-binding response OmpR family regulator